LLGSFGRESGDERRLEHRRPNAVSPPTTAVDAPSAHAQPEIERKEAVSSGQHDPNAIGAELHADPQDQRLVNCFAFGP
jgi:hypothetical protein